MPFGWLRRSILGWRDIHFMLGLLTGYMARQGRTSDAIWWSGSLGLVTGPMWRSQPIAWYGRVAAGRNAIGVGEVRPFRDFLFGRLG